MDSYSPAPDIPARSSTLADDLAISVASEGKLLPANEVTQVSDEVCNGAQLSCVQAPNLRNLAGSNSFMISSAGSTFSPRAKLVRSSSNLENLEAM